MINERLNIINICKELQQENETLNDRWNELQTWVCKNWIENQDKIYTEIIIKMKELEREM